MFPVFFTVQFIVCHDEALVFRYSLEISNISFTSIGEQLLAVMGITGE